MYQNILEARYTNAAQDTIYVLHETEADGVMEEYIEPGSNEHNALVEAGWDHEKLLDMTADFKREQAKTITDIAVQYAADQYKESLALHKKKATAAHALQKKLEKQAPEKIRAINKYVVDNMTSEKLDVAIDNLITFLETINENEEAIELIKKKTGKNIKPKTALDALKHLI
jgi:hypothetical protein